MGNENETLATPPRKLRLPHPISTPSKYHIEKARIAAVNGDSKINVFVVQYFQVAQYTALIAISKKSDHATALNGNNIPPSVAICVTGSGVGNMKRELIEPTKIL